MSNVLIILIYTASVELRWLFLIPEWLLVICNLLGQKKITACDISFLTLAYVSNWLDNIPSPAWVLCSCPFYSTVRLTGPCFSLLVPIYVFFLLYQMILHVFYGAWGVMILHPHSACLSAAQDACWTSYKFGPFQLGKKHIKTVILSSFSIEFRIVCAFALVQPVHKKLLHDSTP